MIATLVGKIQQPFLALFLPASLLDVFWNHRRELWSSNRELLDLRWGRTADQKMVAV
jgi:hypothetical protein